LNGLHRVISQKIELFINTAVITSNATCIGGWHEEIFGKSRGTLSTGFIWLMIRSIDRLL
jgi:hypothetical protein